MADTEKLDLPRPDKWDEGESEYALVRRAGNLPAREWPDERINAVQRMYGQNATSLAELAQFLHVAQRHNLDPALNQIYLIQTKRGPKVYAGRDGYVEAAARYDGYRGHQSGVVYTQDRFTIRVKGKEVEIHHEFAPNQDRGKIHGAYCVAYGEGDRPTVVYREFDKCKNMSSDSWKYHPDDMIENRAIAAALRRQVPLGGLLIEGEQDIGDEGFLEDRIGQTTEQKLDDLEAELGVKDGSEEEIPEAEWEEVPQEPAPAPEQPDVQELSDLFDEKCRANGVTPKAVRAWALHSGAIPDDRGEWGPDHYLVAIQAMKQTDGIEFLAEYARFLMGRDDDIGMTERLELEETLGSSPSKKTVMDMIARLQEREG